MAHQLKTNTSTLEAVLAQINALPDATSGVEFPELTNPATASDALSGKEFINAEGEKVTGTIATKTSSNLTASGATVSVPAGYYASTASKSVSTATQATPSIAVSTGGLITASHTQSAGYVASGTKSATKQLTVQAAKTITPTKSSQTAVASGRYTTGTVTIAAIPSQYEDITTPLADLNTLNGSTATTMATAVDNTEAEVDEQGDVIAQIQAALAGKAAGSGGSATLETGVLTGIGTYGIAESATYVYSLEDISNIESKHLVVLFDNYNGVEYGQIILSRMNTSDNFSCIFSQCAASDALVVELSGYGITIDIGDDIFSTVSYYAA